MRVARLTASAGACAQMFDLIQQFTVLTAPNLGSMTYPYALTKDTSYEDEASFIAYPVGKCVPATAGPLAHSRTHACTLGVAFMHRSFALSLPAIAPFCALSVCN